MLKKYVVIDKQTNEKKVLYVVIVGASTQAPTLLNPTLYMAFQDPLIIIYFLIIIIIILSSSSSSLSWLKWSSSS